MDEETEAPKSYLYRWTKEHELPLDAFLVKYKPSMVQDDGSKPWIWVEKGEGRPEAGDVVSSIEQAAQILEEATEKVEAINSDDTIPTRSNKKTGARSKKELREEIQKKASEDLQKISQETKFTVGKWLFFAQPDAIDGMWTRIAKSLVHGDLSHTPAFLTKVSTSKPTDERQQHLICLYLPDLYDKNAVVEVLKALIGKCGLTPGSAKTDLYTHIGLDSKHPSGIRSTVWQVKELISEDEMKKLRDEYAAGLEAAKPRKAKGPAAQDDPFGDEEEEETDAPAAKGAPKAASKRKDEFDDDDDDEPETKTSKGSSKATTTSNSKPAGKATKRKAASVDDDEDDEETKPAKKAKATTITQSKKPVPKEEESETEYEDEVDDDPIKKPAKKSASAPTTSAEIQKPTATRLGKLKAAKNKYD